VVIERVQSRDSRPSNQEKAELSSPVNHSLDLFLQFRATQERVTRAIEAVRHLASVRELQMITDVEADSVKGKLVSHHDRGRDCDSDSSSANGSERFTGQRRIESSQKLDGIYISSEGRKEGDAMASSEKYY